MPNFKWKERYDIGVNAMNDHHKHLLGLMEQLQTLSDQDASFDDKLKVLVELEDYTVFHFSEEEKYMASIAFPDLQMHQEIHKSLLARLADHKRDFEQSKSFEPKFFDFLRLWLASHICGIDIKYAQHAQRQAG